MNSKKIVKIELLRRKINEYFSKNPNSKGVIIKSNNGNEKNHWKVTKENNSFKIVEVKSTVERFIIEDATSGGGKPLYDPNKKPEITPPKTPIMRTTPPHPAYASQAAIQKNKNTPPPLTPVKKAMPTSFKDPETILKNANTMSRQDFMKTYGFSPQSGRQLVAKTDKDPETILKNADTMPRQHFINKYGFEPEVGKRFAASFPSKTSPSLPGKTEGKLREGSLPFSGISREFVTAMAPPFDHNKLNAAFRKANADLGKITDPNEKAQVGSMIGVLTNLIDTTTNQSSIAKQPPKSPVVPPKPPSTGLNAGKKVQGKKLKEAGKENDIPKQKTLEPKTKPMSSKNSTGLDANTEQDSAPEKEAPKTKSAEQEMVSKALSGQVIKSANISSTSNGGMLELEIQGMAQPVVIEWGPNKIVAKIKDRPFFIKR